MSDSTPPPALNPSAFTSFIGAITRASNKSSTARAEDRPVSRAELVKGFEYDKDRFVVVDDRELDQIASSRVMEVREFVSAAEVDPVYLDASY